MSATQRDNATVLRPEELSLKLSLELEFFKVVLGWTNITNLPSFSVTNGDEKGWAMLSRELQKCYTVKEVFINNKYLVGVQKQKGEGVAVAEGRTLEQAATQALVFAYQGSYANKQQMQELKSALLYKHMQVKLPAFKQFAI